ncbi:MAG: tail fiber domain-containing protein, partial [Bryobacteraceae bacterium]
INFLQIRGDGSIQMASLPLSSSATTGSVCWSGGAAAGNLTVDTTLACLSSTRRIKDHISLLGNALGEVMQLRPVSYNLKPQFNPEHLGRQVGLVAEDVQKIDPRLVGLDSRGRPLGVRYMQMTALLVRAIQQQQVQIDSLNRQLRLLQHGRVH